VSYTASCPVLFLSFLKLIETPPVLTGILLPDVVEVNIELYIIRQLILRGVTGFLLSIMTPRREVDKRISRRRLQDALHIDASH